MKKIIGLFLVLSMLLCVIPVQSADARTNGVQQKINQILAVYSTGVYFTRSGGPCTDFGGEDCKLSNIPSRGGLPAGSDISRAIGEGWSCNAFARYVYYYTFGQAHYSGQTVSSCSLGDFMHLYSERYGNHYAIYLYEDENNYYVYDCNGDLKCGVTYNKAYSKSKFRLQTAYHATNYASVYGESYPGVDYDAITPGVYYLKNKATGKYLSVDSGVDANKQNISVTEWADSNEMKFEIIATSAGYKMRPLCSSARLVNAWGDTPGDGANVTLYDDCAHTSQWWQFEAADGGGYLIHNVYASSCVLDTDVSNGNVLICNKHGGDNQIWYLEPVNQGHIPGDATGDGKVNISDVSVMLRYIAKWDIEIKADAADVTDDGKVNISDVSLMLKYLAKWDVVLK